MGYEAVMDLPLKVFWTMSANVDRITAQQDMRRMNIAQFAQATPEHAQNFRQSLVEEAGTILRVEADPQDDPRNAQRDETGFADLRRMAGQTIGSLA